MITKQALGSLLFGMTDILRDKVEDYKSYILSLLFYKRLSDNYQWEIENGKEKFVNNYCREPSVREMDVISKKMHDFIIPVDKSINEQEQKINSLERLKKSLMQNLLTGKVRINKLINCRGGVKYE